MTSPPFPSEAAVRAAGIAMPWPGHDVGQDEKDEMARRVLQRAYELDEPAIREDEAESWRTRDQLHHNAFARSEQQIRAAERARIQALFEAASQSDDWEQGGGKCAAWAAAFVAEIEDAPAGDQG